MSAQEKLSRPYPLPYIMDSEKVELKLATSLLQDTEQLKELIREFTRYHAFCHHAREMLSCNIDRIALGQKAVKYPKINIPDDCPPDGPWVPKP